MFLSVLAKLLKGTSKRLSFVSIVDKFKVLDLKISKLVTILVE